MTRLKIPLESLWFGGDIFKVGVGGAGNIRVRRRRMFSVLTAASSVVPFIPGILGVLRHALPFEKLAVVGLGIQGLWSRRVGPHSTALKAESVRS